MTIILSAVYRLCLMGLMVGGAALLSASQTRAQSASVSPNLTEKIRWTQRSAEVKLGREDKQGVAHYTFEYVSAEQVAILSLSTSCHCLSATTEKKVYAPKEKGEITVTFTPLPGQGAKTSGTILVETDAPSQLKTALTLTGFVPPPPAGRLEPQALSWPPGEALKPKTISYMPPKGMLVKSVKVISSNPETVNARVEPFLAENGYSIIVKPTADTETMIQVKLTVQVEYADGRVATLLALVQMQ